MLQNLAFTCRSAFEALAQHEVQELRQQNEALRVELFNVSMPSFENVVAHFNDSRRGPQCNCTECQHLGLIHEHWQEDASNECTLWPSWETLLARLEIRVDPQDSVVLGLAVPWWNSHACELASPVLCQHVRLSAYFCGTRSACTAHACHSHFYEDCARSGSTAAVTQWRGKWTKQMQVVGAWGPPARCWDDPRINEWTRLFAAVHDLDRHVLAVHDLDRLPF